MKITEISISRKISTGKYESIDISVSIVPDSNLIFTEIKNLDTQIMDYGITCKE